MKSKGVERCTHCGKPFRYGRVAGQNLHVKCAVELRRRESARGRRARQDAQAAAAAGRT